MTAHTRRLVLHLARYLRRREEIEQAHAEAYQYDAAFDAGEFSGPAHARAERQEMDRAAERLGFISAEVAEEACHVFGVDNQSGAYMHEGVVNLPGITDEWRAAHPRNWMAIEEAAYRLQVARARRERGLRRDEDADGHITAAEVAQRVE